MVWSSVQLSWVNFRAEKPPEIQPNLKTAPSILNQLITKVSSCQNHECSLSFSNNANQGNDNNHHHLHHHDNDDYATNENHDQQCNENFLCDENKNIVQNLDEEKLKEDLYSINYYR